LLKISFISLFPDFFDQPLRTSILGRAAQSGAVSYQVINVRDHALQDKYRTVDDSPYGGGAGMLLRADVLYSAWLAAGAGPNSRTLLMSPQGPRLTQGLAKGFARDYEHLILISGHYEGVDERFIDECVDEELSIGDYVLTGGELPSLVLADCLVRLLPGVLGNPHSASNDSLEGGLLKYPQYTRPPEWRGRAVPEVLTSGDHGKIAAWREAQRQERTLRKRPDLLGGSGRDPIKAP
jgi:tRNA (guanine37-N1)-methyltransferase